MSERKSKRMKWSDEWDRAIAALAQAHPTWDQNIVNGMRKGHDCQRCGQRTQLYRQTLNCNMILILSFMYGFVKKYYPKGGWVHVNDAALDAQLNVTNLQFGKLRFWGLIEERTMTVEESIIKRNAGYWRVTDMGHGFLKQGLRIPAAVYLFDGNKYYMSDDEPVGPTPHVNYDTLMMNKPKLKFRFAKFMAGELGVFEDDSDPPVDGNGE